MQITLDTQSGIYADISPNTSREHIGWVVIIQNTPLPLEGVQSFARTVTFRGAERKARRMLLRVHRALENPYA